MLMIILSFKKIQTVTSVSQLVRKQAYVTFTHRHTCCRTCRCWRRHPDTRVTAPSTRPTSLQKNRERLAGLRQPKNPSLHILCTWFQPTTVQTKCCTATNCKCIYLCKLLKQSKRNSKRLWCAAVLWIGGISLALWTQSDLPSSFT